MTNDDEDEKEEDVEDEKGKEEDAFSLVCFEKNAEEDVIVPPGAAAVVTVVTEGDPDPRENDEVEFFPLKAVVVVDAVEGMELIGWKRSRAGWRTCFDLKPAAGPDGSRSEEKSCWPLVVPMAPNPPACISILVRIGTRDRASDLLTLSGLLSD